MNFEFNSLEISPLLLKVVSELGYKKLTPIQAQAIPLILEGKDIIGQSKTGSGKTAAFALPILNKINLDKKHVQALVLCPTRELCTQVAREMRKFARDHSGMQILILSGGQPMYPQLIALEKGVHIVVGTPGRVIDHLRRGSLDLSNLSTLVLDEADRMLDMGFQEDMEIILDTTPKSRQTVFFSATFPRSIETLSKTYQKNPEWVKILEDVSLMPTIEQFYIECSYANKLSALIELIQEYDFESVIIFCNLKVTVFELTKELKKLVMSVDGLQGDLEQSDRDRVMAKFRNQSTRILIATDVAARGLDVENLDAVINFDLPTNLENYTHRIGRTGRAGKSGKAFSFVSSNEKWRIQEIEKNSGQKIQLKKISENSIEKNFAHAKMKTLFIGGGRKDKMRPGDILGALTGTGAGLKASEVGKIEIHDRFSYVAIQRDLFHQAHQQLSIGQIKGKKFRVEAVR